MIEFLTAATPLQWLLAFALLTALDIAWACYVNAAGSSPAKASGWAVVLFLLGGVAVIGYTTAPVLLIPSAVGAFAGTYLGVLLSRRKESL